MFKKINQHLAIFKLAQLIVFCALFFAQMQVSFIEHAYGSDSINAFSQYHTTGHKSKITVTTTKQNDSDAGYTKLNKRYPLSHALAAFTPQQITQPSFAFVYLRCIYASPDQINNFHNAFSFRGPPAISLS